MSVRHALLAILEQGPCYGYQLRSEYARRTDVALNVGQIYTTLERLERDGMVAHQGADERGHVYWGITDAGREAARHWLSEPSAPSGRDELAHRIALSATLPGVDAEAVIAAQRASTLERLTAIDGRESDGGVAGAIVHAAEAARARAELEWLDAAKRAISAAGEGFGLSTERPRRGRPVREAAGHASV
ncbi:PadR family transcriptional regulator [Microbacterium sp. P04]|uniref:PadR family transcriptional regulator n=1 Tax=Microbacterium sp. P04 TaxID=3366947 RepID=UPI003746FD60